MKRKGKIKGKTLIVHFICITACVLFMFPIGLMLKKSFAVNGFGNYTRVFQSFNLFLNLGNSCLITGLVLLLVACALTPAAFAFSKLEFRGRKLCYYVLLMGMMIPGAALVFPLFMIVKKLGLLGTQYSVIFPYAVLSSCFNLMMLKNYFDSLPDELLEATYIDGGGMMRAFVSVMMPLAKPGIAFVLIQTFLTSWNELQLAMTFIADKEKLPLSVIPIHFAATTGSAQFPIQVMFAALVICLLPIAIFYVFASRFMIEGLTQGAVKG